MTTLFTYQGLNGKDIQALQPFEKVASPVVLNDNNASNFTAIDRDAMIAINSTKIIHIKFKKNGGDSDVTSSSIILPPNQLHFFPLKEGQIISVLRAEAEITTVYAEYCANYGDI